MVDNAQIYCSNCGAGWMYPADDDGNACPDQCEECGTELTITTSMRVDQERIAELEAALAAVREQVCKGPVDDTLWADGTTTTVDEITLVLGDDWDYDAWLAANPPKPDTRWYVIAWMDYDENDAWMAMEGHAAAKALYDATVDRDSVSCATMAEMTIHRTDWM